MKQAAELLVGNVQADRRAGMTRTQRVHNRNTAGHETGLRDSQFSNEFTQDTGWKLAFTLLDRLVPTRDTHKHALGISIHPS